MVFNFDVRAIWREQEQRQQEERHGVYLQSLRDDVAESLQNSFTRIVYYTVTKRQISNGLFWQNLFKVESGHATLLLQPRNFWKSFRRIVYMDSGNISFDSSKAGTKERLFGLLLNGAFNTRAF